MKHAFKKGLGLLFFLFVTHAVLGLPRVIDDKKNINIGELTKSESGFVENLGQMKDMNGNLVPFVLFKSEAPGLNFWITDKGFVIETRQWEKIPVNEDELTEDEKMDQIRTGRSKKIKILKWERIDVELQGAVIKKENIIKEEVCEWEYNFFHSHCPDGIYGAKEYKKITIKDVYPGIDWVFYRKADGTLKYDFIVHPDADYKQIQIVYRSKLPVIIDEDGYLCMTTNNMIVKEKKPVSFYENKEVTTNYKLIQQLSSSYQGDNCFVTQIGFECFFEEGNDINSVLVIDPQLSWSTFFGGNDFDGAYSMTSDPFGNIFITGYLASTDFPSSDPGSGAYFVGTGTGDKTIFISKFSNSGALVWSTYYGDSGDNAIGITCDSNGNIFITGYTVLDTNFPTYNPGGGAYYQGTSLGIEDAFILKFNNNGVREWATLYTCDGRTRGHGIVTDAMGNVYVTGYTKPLMAPSDFPLLNPGGGAYYQTWQGDRDVFLLKFNNTGVRQWATLYGGSENDEGYALSVDNMGNVILVGKTMSANFPVYDSGSGAYYDASFGGGTDSDAFILKFNSSGSREWATYYGGNAIDFGCSVATDDSSNVIVAGFTSSSDFQTQDFGSGGFYQNSLAGISDAFVLKFDSLNVRKWATYVGGSNSEVMNSYDNITIDMCGNFFVSFDTESNDMGTLTGCDGGFTDNSLSGTMDVFVTSFNRDAALLWATYIGGDGDDFRSPIEVVNGDLFLSGEWTSVVLSSSYPLANPGSGAYYDATFNGSLTLLSNADDSFLMKFSLDSCSCDVVAFSVNIVATEIQCYNDCNGTATATPIGGNAPFTYLWNTFPIQSSQTAINLCSGTYTVTVTDALNNSTTASVILNNPPQIDVDLGTDQSICFGDSIILDAGLWSSYDWSNSATTQSIVVHVEGFYSVTVTDSNGCQAIDTVFVAVVNQQDATINPSGPFCLNDSPIVLTASDQGGTWTGNGITDAVAGTFNPNSAGVGVHTVYYTIYGSCGDADSIVITVYGLPEPDFIGFPLSGCPPLEVEFTDQSVNADLWVWNFGDGNSVSGIQNPTHIYDNSGFYDVTLQVTSSFGCSQSILFSNYIEVFYRPEADFYTEPEIGKIYDPTITFFSDANATSWLWKFGDDTESTLSPPLSHTYPSVEETYEVKLIVSSENDCMDSIVKNVMIIDDILVFSNVITPNGDGYNDCFVIENCDKYEGNILQIFNRWGNIVFETENYNNKWDGEDLADGTYYFIFMYTNKEYHGSLTIIKSN